MSTQTAEPTGHDQADLATIYGTLPTLRDALLRLAHYRALEHDDGTDATDDAEQAAALLDEAQQIVGRIAPGRRRAS